MIIRKYVSTDCKQVADLFYETVHSVNAKDYTIEQLDAWADGSADLEKWDKSFIENYTLVAVEDNCIVGFGDIDRTGYLDMLFVHKDFQGQGIASAICDRLEASITTDKIATHASITAKPFFEKRGYKSVKEQQVIRKGIHLTNYVMEKQQQLVAWLP
ncbi:MAG: GNAT family N-acetyltransferase [Firmicutes bacterium]|nr:GNAT family N-acetyltransferase [Bacillota bacterium]